MCRVILFKWTNTESWGFTLDATFCCMNVTYETTNVQFARWHHLIFDFLWMFHFLTEPLRGKWDILSLSFVYTLVCVAESSFSFCLFHKNCLFRMFFFVFSHAKLFFLQYIFFQFFWTWKKNSGGKNFYFKRKLMALGSTISTFKWITCAYCKSLRTKECKKKKV